MKRRFTGALFALSVVGTSCGGGASSNLSNEPSAHGLGFASDTAWRLTYQATCVDGAAENCLGLYGFSVTNDGFFQVGPGPNHERVSGRLLPEEYRDFQKILGQIHLADFEINAFAPDQCVQAETGPVSSVQLAYQQLSHGIVRKAGADLCFDSAFVRTSRDASALEAWISDMNAKYYPATFPNACVTAAVWLEQGFDELKQCQRDADCAYLDPDFLPVTHPGVQIVVDDCTNIETLPVANSAAATANQAELVMQRQLARNTCGDSLQKPSCSHSWSFDSGATAPICVENICRIGPGVQYH